MTHFLFHDIITNIKMSLENLYFNLDIFSNSNVNSK